jgi:CheY-like chemotaxis protein
VAERRDTAAGPGMETGGGRRNSVVASQWEDDDGAIGTIDSDRPNLPMPEGIEDDRDTIVPGDRTVMIIEDDIDFARILLDMARDKDFKGIVAVDGDSALETAHVYQPDAITLDVDLPGIDGWAVLDRLKHHPNTRHIPVHIISGIRERQQGLKAGAMAYLEKPVTKEALEASFTKIAQFIDQPVKRLLVVEDDENQRKSMVELIAHEDVEITAVATADEALEQLGRGRFDCMVLDLGLAGPSSGFDLLERVKGDPAMNEIPIIIYTGKSLSPAEETQLRKFAENGRDGIAKLEETPGIDLVLMDVMMPEMDGYETMQAIRQKPEFASLPIIALTAKAMKGDREKCIAAGASDYITKPVDTDQLLSLMRVWLYR